MTQFKEVKPKTKPEFQLKKTKEKCSNFQQFFFAIVWIHFLSFTLNLHYSPQANTDKSFPPLLFSHLKLLTSERAV
jgi:hypothetical protein